MPGSPAPGRKAEPTVPPFGDDRHLSAVTDGEPVLRIAHGAGNHLTALAPALAAGADLVEADVHTRRGRLEVRHADSLGPLPWMWESGELLRADELFLPTLLRALPAGLQLMLDLKGWHPGLGVQVRQALEAGAPGAPYAVCCRTWSLLDAFAGLEHVRVVHSVGTRRELARLPARLSQAQTWGVSVRGRLLTREAVRSWRRHAEVVMAWHVDTAQEFRRVIALGVNGVVSNDLAALPHSG